MNTIAAWITLAVYVSFGFRAIRDKFSEILLRLGDWVIALLLLPYLLAVEFRPSGGDFLRMVLFLILPTLLLRLRSSRAKSFDFLQVLSILAIWVPVETDLFLLFIDQIFPIFNLSTTLTDFYLLPEVNARLVTGVELPIQTLIALLLALYLFLIRHPLNRIGFSFRFNFEDLKIALIGLAGFVIVGLPVGLGIGFISFNPEIPTLVDLIFGLLGGYLLTALMEEVLFRGIIQNLLTMRVSNNLVVLGASSIIFGIAHLNNTTPGYPIPNWGYVLMATLAGLAYGWVWQKTGKVTVSAITHMLVNLLWGLVFS